MPVSVGWIGLGAMGSGMASSLLEQGFPVRAYDVYTPSTDAAVAKGATRCATPAEAAQGVQVLALMVVNAAQVEEVLFGSGKVAEVLESNASIICFSTVPPTFQAKVQERLNALGKGLGLVDAPVSGGFLRAAEGQLSIMVSGTDDAIGTARPALEALTRKPHGNLVVVGDRVGKASDFKLINQVLCAIHIAVAGEAMALGANLGANPRKLYNALREKSFMFGHRVPWVLENDGVIKSALTIIHKDVSIVMDEARLIGFPAPLSSVTEQLFVAGIGAGLAKEDDIGIVRLWERFGGRPVAESGTPEEEERKAAAAEGGEDAIALVGRLLDAVHIVSAAEALAFARHKGMDLAAVFNVVGTSAASSKPLVAFKDELSYPDKFSPQAGQATVDEVLTGLIEVVAAAKRTNTPLFLGQAAYQQFETSAARGEGAQGASIVRRLWK